MLAASEPQRQEQDIVKAFSSVMHSLPMGVFSLDKAGNVIVWNKTAENILGWTPDEIIGNPALFLPPQSLNKLDKMQEAVWQGTIFNNVDIPHQKKDGTLINLSLFLSPLKDSDNNITGTIGFFFHPSISYKGEETDFSALTKLEYLKMVYHELRIPLVSLMGWIQLLRLVKLGDSETSYQLETIERTAQMAAHLIEDLVDISNMKEGKFGLKLRLIDFTTIVKTAINMVSPSIDAKDIRFKIVLDPGACLVMGDPIRLQQVVWNLLSNAVKFTSNGGNITIRLEKNDSHAQLIISDTGDGIDKNLLPYIFERYRQPDWDNFTRHKGLGLGLAIAKHIVALHHGTIEATSDGQGMGSTFKVKIPLTKSSRA